MLICVDGTGPTADLASLHTDMERAGNYAVAMMGSFVGLTYYGSHIPNKKYFRGPDFSGTGPNMIRPMDLVSVIRNFWRQGDHEIFLVGYSRGAAILVNTAALLGVLPMPDGTKANVDALFLFDAVDRSPDLASTSQVPSNVKCCYHAMRSDAAGSRRSFGNCATEVANGQTVMATKEFFTTHGGMGGVLWGKAGTDVDREMRDFVPTRADGPSTMRVPVINRAELDRIRLSPHIYEGFPDGITNVTVAQEEAGSKEVHDWMWGFLRHKHPVLT